MIEIRQTEAWEKWFGSLKDIRARAKIIARIRRVSLGNFGDVRPVGNGISELRIHCGPGYRIYLVSKGDEIVILLGGGDKAPQKRDIAAAIKLASEIED